MFILYCKKLWKSRVFYNFHKIIFRICLKQQSFGGSAENAEPVFIWPDNLKLSGSDDDYGYEYRQNKLIEQPRYDGYAADTHDAGRNEKLSSIRNNTLQYA